MRTLEDHPTATFGRLTAGDAMTAPAAAVDEHDSMAAAWELLARSGGRHLPVVRRGRCLGLVDDHLLLAAWRPGSMGLGRREVRDLLPSSFPSVAPETPLAEVARILHGRSPDALPVLDGDRRLLGLVTAAGMVAAVAGLAPPPRRQVD